MADDSVVEFDCKEKGANFCYVCAKYVSDKLKSKFTKLSQERYMALFNAPNLKNFGYSFTGKVVCGSCKGRLSGRTKHEGKFNVPAIWHAPKTPDHDDCYLCQTELTEEEKREPRKFEYDGSLSVELPQILKKLPKPDIFDDSDFSDDDEERVSPADQTHITNPNESRMIDDSRYEDESRYLDESRVGDVSRIVDKSSSEDESDSEDEQKAAEKSILPSEDPKESNEDPKEQDDDSDKSDEEKSEDEKSGGEKPDGEKSNGEKSDGEKSDGEKSEDEEKSDDDEDKSFNDSKVSADDSRGPGDDSKASNEPDLSEDESDLSREESLRSGESEDES